MSEGRSHGWETHTRGFSNSDNSGHSEERSGKKPPESSSNSPLATTPVAPKRGRDDGSGNTKATELNESKGSESDHEIHIVSERERRKKMRDMFSNLQAHLPHLPPKPDKFTIVDEAVNYIQTLQQTLQRLQRQRLEMMRGAPSRGEPSMMVASPAAGAFEISRESFMANQGSSKSWAMVNSAPTTSTPYLPHCFQTWCSPNVTLSVSGNDAHISICAPARRGMLTPVLYILEKHMLEVITTNISSDYFRTMYMIHARANGVRDQFNQVIAVEEICKLAVGEIIMWLSS